MNLSRVNLNLLVALDVLLTERHVTRAGQKLNITQSAMSNILKQLRETFKDELFVRGRGNVMLPTPRALALAEPVRDALNKAAIVFANPEPFIPGKARRSFVLGMSDYSEFVLLPALMQQIIKQAPHIDIVVKHLNYLTDETMLADSTIDLAVGIYAEIPSGLLTQELFKDRSVCVGWKQNPLLKKPLTFAEYAKVEHLVTLFFESRAETLSEQQIKAANIARKVRLTLPHALSALYVLPQTNLIALVLERVAKVLGSKLELATQPAPFSNPIAIVRQVWHPKTTQDPAQIWLRQLVAEVAASLT